MYVCKKNPLRVTMVRLHEAYYFSRVLSMPIFWRAITYAGVWACAPLESRAFTTLFCITTH